MKQFKKNEFYEGEVISLNFPNKGQVRVEGIDEAEGYGTLVQVKDTLPGQRVRFQLKKARKSRPEGRLTEVLNPSRMEDQVPPCPHFAECGGCSYQTMDYANQKQLKLSQVQSLLGKVCPGIPLRECLSSPLEWEYRNKMEFSFGDEVKDGPLALGLHKRGSFYDIVPVTECRIVDEDIRKVLTATMSFFRERQIPYFHKMRHEGILRHLLVRKARNTGEMLVCLVTASQWRSGTSEGAVREWRKEEVLAEYVDLLLGLDLSGNCAGILHMANDALSDVVKSDDTSLLYGRDYFYEELLGLKFKISPFSFFQTNSAGAEVLYRVAREYVGDVEGKVVFDLYSGTGTIAQVLAPVAEKVVGVELVGEAVDAARENAGLNRLDNCTFLAGDVLKVIDGLDEVPDIIVLDPPREGIHPKALTKILDFGVERVVYISCKPTSLARDLEVFLSYGYKPIRAQCVDLFPWTRGIESIVLLSKFHTKQNIEVELEMSEMD